MLIWSGNESDECLGVANDSIDSSVACECYAVKTIQGFRFSAISIIFIILIQKKRTPRLVEQCFLAYWSYSFVSMCLNWLHSHIFIYDECWSYRFNWRNCKCFWWWYWRWRLSQFCCWCYSSNASRWNRLKFLLFIKKSFMWYFSDNERNFLTMSLIFL